MLFIDLSSAFNSIQPHFFFRKQTFTTLKPGFVFRIIRSLVNNTQNVVFQSNKPSLGRNSTGALQGTAVSSFLFTLFIDFKESLTCPLIRFSDYSGLIGLSKDDESFTFLIF